MNELKPIISMADVEYVAKLAHLQFSATEMVDCTVKLASILDYMKQLQKIDTTGVPPTTHVLPLENVFREDSIGQCLPQGAALANAPQQQDGYFKVPKIL
ncbi:MAG: Asp-tRNA(Asn)/Glu-tRNA(Gln) amidotransferase subunit GatC [Clostridiales bacterium]